MVVLVYVWLHMYLYMCLSIYMSMYLYVPAFICISRRLAVYVYMCGWLYARWWRSPRSLVGALCAIILRTELMGRVDGHRAWAQAQKPAGPHHARHPGQKPSHAREAGHFQLLKWRSVGSHGLVDATARRRDPLPPLAAGGMHVETSHASGGTT